MISRNLNYFFIITLLCFLFPNNDKNIENLKREKVKIEQEIKAKDEKIEELNKDLELIQRKITDTTKNLNETTKNTIKGQKDLKKLIGKIGDIEDLLISIENDLKNLNRRISKQSMKISIQESKIDSIQEIINDIELEFEKRTKAAYRFTSKADISWKEKKYLKELNRYTDYNDLNKEEKYLSQILKLHKNKLELENALKDFEISLLSKIKLYDFKNKALKDLTSSKKTKKHILEELKKDRGKLEEKLAKNKEKEKEKEKEIKSIQEWIGNLLENKEKNKKRTEELIKIRLEQNREISGNFSKMRGALSWPINGIVISKFGIEINKELNTKTENHGIEIKSSSNKTVVSVMDGIVMAITVDPMYGSLILIDHGEEYTTVYSNFDEIFVYEDDYVSSGTIIGKVSESGSKKGILGFQIWEKESPINPEPWLLKK